MDEVMGARSAPHIRARRVPRGRATVAAGALAIAALVAACSGGSLPVAGAGGGGNAQATGAVSGAEGQSAQSGGGGGNLGDACGLLSSDEIASVTGHKVVSSKGSSAGGNKPQCHWDLESGMGADLQWSLEVDIVSPGGRADYADTKAFTQQFMGPLQSLAAPVASLAAPFGSFMPGLSGNIIGGFTPVQGLGDDAFFGAGNTLYAVKGDTEVSLQLIDLEDAGATDFSRGLMQKVLSRI